MRRIRKVFYEVRVEGKWWCGRKVGWVADLASVRGWGASDSRYFRTCKRAAKHAQSLGSGTKLLQWSFNRGRRILKEVTVR